MIVSANRGLGTADFLAQRVRKMEVLAPDPQNGADVEAVARMALMLRLSMMGVKLSPDTALQKISGDVITVTDLYTRQDRVIKCIDTMCSPTAALITMGFAMPLKAR